MVDNNAKKVAPPCFPWQKPVLSRLHCSLSYTLLSIMAQAVLTKEFFDSTHGKHQLVLLSNESELKTAKEHFAQVVRAGTTSDYYRCREQVVTLINSADSLLFVLRSTEDKQAGNLAFAVVTENHNHVVLRVAYTLPNGKGRWAISHLVHLFHEKWHSLEGFKIEPVGFAVDLSAKFVKSTVETLASFYPKVAIYCVDSASLGQFFMEEVD